MLMAARHNNSSIQEPSSTSANDFDPCKDPAYFKTSAISAAVASCYAILIPLTVLGNGFVIAACVSNTRLRTATNIFIVGLAASDMLVGTFSIPFWTFIVSHENIMAGYCFAMPYMVYISFDIFAGCASILQLTAIAIERFISMQWPLIHRKMPQCIYSIMLAFAWLCATVMAVLQPLQGKTELWRKTYTVVLFALCFCLPFLIIVTCYCYIFKITRFQTRRRLSSCSDSQRCGTTPGLAIKESTVAITVAIITGLFLAAWFPFFVVSVIAMFCVPCLPSHSTLLHLIKFLKFLQYASSAINPYIYAYRIRDMRRTITKIAGKVFPCNLTRFETRNSFFKRDAKRSIQQSTDGSYNEAMPKDYVSLEKDVFEEEIKMKHPREHQKKRHQKTMVVIPAVVPMPPLEQPPCISIL